MRSSFLTGAFANVQHSYDQMSFFIFRLLADPSLTDLPAAQKNPRIKKMAGTMSNAFQQGQKAIVNSLHTKTTADMAPKPTSNAMGNVLRPLLTEGRKALAPVLPALSRLLASPALAPAAVMALTLYILSNPSNTAIMADQLTHYTAMFNQEIRGIGAAVQKHIPAEITNHISETMQPRPIAAPDILVWD